MKKMFSKAFNAMLLEAVQDSVNHPNYVTHRQLQKLLVAKVNPSISVEATM